MDCIQENVLLHKYKRNERFYTPEKTFSDESFNVMRKHTQLDLEPCPPPLISINIPASNGLLMSWTGSPVGSGGQRGDDMQPP